MATGRAAAVGAGAAFVLAALAGVLGNQLAVGAPWAWAGFAAAVAAGAAVTAWAALPAPEAGCGTTDGHPAPAPGESRIARQHNVARDSGRVFAAQDGDVVIRPRPGGAESGPPPR
ncbi:hypothetical protein LG943_05830 [Streptomonospora sp. S1-112]|uniref:Uncharacterized protein n=1 Tax=Streptomonospora mangrovi TaxID=2883123 RepID=A0A9X3SCM4_9ACTN|nr:hypothetical protein [Streptomonospora mangrovi]MDA0563848.1 hypothetical protein [Streptomonospora mangrovi]